MLALLGEPISGDYSVAVLLKSTTMRGQKPLIRQSLLTNEQWLPYGGERRPSAKALEALVDLAQDQYTSSGCFKLPWIINTDAEPYFLKSPQERRLVGEAVCGLAGCRSGTSSMGQAAPTG